AVRAVHAEVLGAFRSRRTLLGMLCLAAPVGPAAAVNLFSAIAGQYHVGSETTIIMTGFGGSALAACGCLLGGLFADHMNRWRAFLSAGLVIGIFAILVAGAPRVALVFVAAVAVYMILSGVASATYTALLLEVIGKDSRATAGLYTWLNNLGNLPV